MDVRYLNYILTIAERQNMTKAAEELYVSQSSSASTSASWSRKLGCPSSKEPAAV